MNQKELDLEIAENNFIAFVDYFEELITLIANHDSSVETAIDITNKKKEIVDFVMEQMKAQE